MWKFLLALMILITGCGDGVTVPVDVPAADMLSDSARDVVTPGPADYSRFGSYTVGHVHVDLIDSSRDRTLPVEIWYPATEAVREQFEAGKPVTEMFSAENNTLLAPYLESPSQCLTTTVHAVRDAEPASGQWPLVVFSHCSSCIRTSNVSTVERLVSHGFAVVAADHVGDTLWDSIRDGSSAAFAEDFLVKRGEDVVFLLDTVLNPENADVPEIVRGRFDADRVAMFGHSFGAMTTGLVTTTDDRIKGAVLHTAPFAAYYYLIEPEDCNKPVYTIVAMEDSMITLAGNELLRGDFERLGGPAWKVEVQDAGHLSFHDLCRVRESFHDCCGQGARQSDQSFNTFTYMDQQESMQAGATYTTAFIAWLLLGDAAAREVFETPLNDRISITVRNPPAVD